MQKAWIVGALALVLLMGGLGGGIWIMRQNKPEPYWLELPMREGLSKEEFNEVIKSFHSAVTSDGVVIPTVKELNLTGEWKLAEEPAAAELRKRLYVRKSDVGGRLVIGLQGKRKEAKQTKAIVNHIGALLGRELKQYERQKAATPSAAQP